MPSLDETYRRYAEKGMRVFLVNLKEKPAEVAPFIERFKYDSTVLFDRDGEVAKKFHVMGIPTSLLLDKAGRIVFRSNGSVYWQSAKMESLLNEILNEE